MDKVKNFYKSHKEMVLLCTLFIIATTLFFSFSVSFAPDSIQYYYYSIIFDGEVPFSEWWAVRGFTYPFYIFLITSIFGKTRFGLLVSLYLPYILTLAMFYLLLRKIIGKERTLKYIYFIFFAMLLFIIFNPIVLGYSHFLLTECIEPLFIMVAFYLSLYWNKVDKNTDLKMKIIYILLFAILSVVVWFLKQPYYPVIFFIFLISGVLSIIKKHDKFNVLYKSGTLIVALVAILGVASLWSNFLKSKDVDTTTINPYLANSFVGALRPYYKAEEKDVCNTEYIENSKLSDEDKKKLLKKVGNNECENFIIYNILNMDREKIIEQKVIFYEDKLSYKDSLSFLVKEFFNHPLLILRAYYNNYMAAIGLHETFVRYNVYTAGDEFFLDENENVDLAMTIFTPGYDYYWGGDLDDLGWGKYNPYVEHLKAPKGISAGRGKIYKSLFPFNNIIFKLCFLSIPILTIVYLVKFFKAKNDKYILLVTIFGSSFLHTLFHVVTGAFIDRYLYVVLLFIYLGVLIILLSDKVKSQKQKRARK